jgi:hypothetical protein
LARLDDGYLRLYAGSRPESADDPVPATARLLIEARFARRAFAPSKNGIARAGEMYSGPAVASGQPSWYRCLQADGESVVFDGSVSATDPAADMVVAGPIEKGQVLSITEFTYGEAPPVSPERSQRVNRAPASPAHALR